MIKPSTPAGTRAPRATKAKVKRTVSDYMREPSTWAGILSIGAAFATGGASALANPATLASIGAGLSLILTREG